MFLILLWWARKNWLYARIFFCFLISFNSYTENRTALVVLLAVALIIAGWFIAHAEPLRFIVLFVGTMNALYSLFDILDDLVFRKVNESDASVFAKQFGGSSQCWGVLWLCVSFLFLVAGIVVSSAFCC